MSINITVQRRAATIVAVESHRAYIGGAELAGFYSSPAHQRLYLRSFGVGFAFSRPRLDSPESELNSFSRVSGLFLCTELT